MRPAAARTITLAAARLAWPSLLCLGVMIAGCSPKIGDACSTSTNCSQKGDRLCDPSPPGGYCTVFNCEPDTCPEDESVCVAFNDKSCASLESSARLLRTWCMATCESDDDCRDGYACVALGIHAPGAGYPNMWIVDTSPPGPGVCTVPRITTTIEPVDGGSGVCEVPDAPFPPQPDAEAAEAATVDAAQEAATDAAEEAATDAGFDAGADSAASDASSDGKTSDASLKDGGSDAKTSIDASSE